MDYEAETGRAQLNLGNDKRYVLDHIDKYIRPLQDKGRKVCICLEGGGTGLGFCNLTAAQIVDFVRASGALKLRCEILADFLLHAGSAAAFAYRFQ